MRKFLLCQRRSLYSQALKSKFVWNWGFLWKLYKVNRAEDEMEHCLTHVLKVVADVSIDNIFLFHCVLIVQMSLLIVILLLITFSLLNQTFFCGNNTYPVPPAGYKVLCGVWHVTPILLSKSLQSVKKQNYKSSSWKLQQFLSSISSHYGCCYCSLSVTCPRTC